MLVYLFAGVVAIFLSLLPVDFACSKEVEVELPDNASTALISNEINQNGMMLSIRTFDSPDTVDSVLDFYRAVWFQDKPIVGFLESTIGEWKIISRKKPGSNIVLQLKLKQPSGSSGFMSVAQMTSDAKPLDETIPLPVNAKIFSSTLVKENHAKVNTIIFTSKQPIKSNMRFYEERMSRVGWSVAQNVEVNGSHVLLLNRRNDQCEIVIQKLNEEDTVIFVNLVNRDG